MSGVSWNKWVSGFAPKKLFAACPDPHLQLQMIWIGFNKIGLNCDFTVNMDGHTPDGGWPVSSGSVCLTLSSDTSPLVFLTPKNLGLHIHTLC